MFTEFPVRAARAEQFAWIEQGRGKLNYTFVENVVDALVLAASCVKAHGENFIISDGVCTFRQFLTLLLGPMAETLPSYTRSELIEQERLSRPTWRDLVRGLMNDEVMHAVNGIPVLSNSKKFIEKRFSKIMRECNPGDRLCLIARIISCTSTSRASVLACRHLRTD